LRAVKYERYEYFTTCEQNTWTKQLVAT
jgi:hypothetical protein